jgi:hypothetical protein
MLPGSKFVLVDGEAAPMGERSVEDEPEKGGGYGYRMARSAEDEPEKGYGYHMTRSVADEPEKEDGY